MCVTSVLGRAMVHQRPGTGSPPTARLITTAYIETSVVSYLTARPSRDVVIAAYQQITCEWWRVAPDRFDLVVSALVLTEAGAGDARMDTLEEITLADHHIGASIPTPKGSPAATIRFAASPTEETVEQRR